MATCPACAKTVSGDKPTCYFCGAFLVPRLECPKCKRAIPQTRTTCHYCGCSLAGAKLADAAPDAKSPGPPPALVTPDIQLEAPSPFAAWLERHETAIDLTLLVLAAPMAFGAMATQAIVGTFARMRRSG